MAKIDFGGTMEDVITSEEFPLEKAKEILKDETIAILGYGVQGPAQALNLRDNGFSTIIGQMEGDAYWEKAVSDGFVPGETLFPIEEAAKRGTIIKELLSDAGQVATRSGQAVGRLGVGKARDSVEVLAVVAPFDSPSRGMGSSALGEKQMDVEADFDVICVADRVRVCVDGRFLVILRD